MSVIFSDIVKFPDVSKAWESSLLTNWLNKFKKSGCIIHKLILKSIVEKENGEIYSILLELFYTTPEGATQIRSILLRGKACVVIPIIYIENQLFFLLVKQRRVIDGNFSLEFPAGKIELGKNAIQTAQEELLQECGINLPLPNFQLLSESLMVCESAFDETVSWFYCMIEESSIRTHSKNFIFGEHSNGEFTYPEIISIDKLLKINSFQIKTGLQLLRENGVLKQNRNELGNNHYADNDY